MPLGKGKLWSDWHSFGLVVVSFSCSAFYLLKSTIVLIREEYVAKLTGSDFVGLREVLACRSQVVFYNDFSLVLGDYGLCIAN